MLDAKLDALDTIIGEENLGHQADSLTFPKPQTSKGPLPDQVRTFSINMMALLKHLENQSNQYRKKPGYC